MKIRIFSTIMLFLAITGCLADNTLSVWKTDFKHQTLASRPKIETRYTDATRTSFDIDAENYRLIADMKSGNGQSIRKLQIVGDNKTVDILSGNGIYLQLTDSNGKTYSSLNTKEASRINIYRRGPYYVETHWLDVQLTDSTGKPAPIKGEIVFYSYPEKVHIGVILHTTAAIEIKNACIMLEFDAETCASIAKDDAPEGIQLNDFCLIKRANNAPSCTIIYPVPKGIDDVILEKIDKGVRVCNYIYNSDSHNNANAKLKEGDKSTAYFELLPLPNSEVSQDMEAEINPLLSSSITAKSGRVLGYDPIRGCYKIQTDNLGDFSYHYYADKNAYESATFSIQDNDIPRKLYILHETRNNPGFVECGVVLDANSNTLPITVQTSKNFSYEKEEPFYNPNDTAFSETIFPIYLDAGEKRNLTSLHLYQNWGKHPLKQLSSLGAWMDYYHMSTGVTETTCYVPFLFAGLNGVNIADMRPMSQKMWEDQPQHDNVAGHSFLRYQDKNNTWHFVEYTGTTFQSTGPNWANMTLNYLSDDGKAKLTINTFEFPQTDELRNFINMHIDFTGDIDIKNGDMARYVRLLNISSWVQGMRYTKVAYGGPTGDPTIVSIKLNDDYTTTGAELPMVNGFATVYPDQHGANSYIVRNIDGKIDGEKVAPGVSLFGKSNGDTTLMLVPITKAKKIKSGDYLDIDMFIMPYGGVTEDYKPAQKAVLDYGLNAPKITSITQGKKLSNFPPKIALSEDGKAEFSLTGGLNSIPIIIEGAKNYTSLRLYNADNEKVLIDHSRPGKKDGYQVYVKDDGTFGYVFLINADGKEHKYLVE